MAQTHHPGGAARMPVTMREREAVRKHCRRLVLRRATLSAGIGAVPLPGLDVVSDFSMLAKLIDEINQAYGLTPAQIDRLEPTLRLATYEVIRRVGSAVVGRLITHEVVVILLQRIGMKMMVRHSAKIVPVAGQIVSAAIGFSAFRLIGHQHIEACEAVASALELLPGRPA